MLTAIIYYSWIYKEACHWMIMLIRTAIVDHMIMVTLFGLETETLYLTIAIVGYVMKLLS